MPHAGRAAQAGAHPTVGSCPSHQQGQTESGMGAELILQPWRGRGKEAVSQQGSLGSRVGHRGINYSTWASVSLSRADEPAHTLCLSRLDEDRGISPRGMQSRAGSGELWGGRSCGAGWFSRDSSCASGWVELSPWQDPPSQVIETHRWVTVQGNWEGCRTQEALG